MKVSGNAWSISTPTPLSNLQIAFPLEQNRHKVAQLVLRNLLLGFNDYGMLTAVVPFAKRPGQPAHSATVHSCDCGSPLCDCDSPPCDAPTPVPSSYSMRWLWREELWNSPLTGSLALFLGPFFGGPLLPSTSAGGRKEGSFSSIQGIGGTTQNAGSP